MMTITKINLQALYMEELLQDMSFYDDLTRSRPSISMYLVDEPTVGQSVDGSLDIILVISI